MQIQSNSQQSQLFNVTSEIQSQILNEIRSSFTQEEQTLYINSLLMYMNYHQTQDYLVDLSKVYEMIGFNEKGKAKRTLEKNFTENLDYKIIQEGQEANFACPYGQALNPEANRVRGCAGKNKETILLNIDTFKNLCMIAKTEKAKELRRYFVKIEAVVHSVISKQVVAPLEITFTNEQINNSNRLINHFGPKKDIFYMFSFKYKEEMYAKFGIVGHTREFHKRVEEHQIEFGEICFHYTVKCKDVSLVESEFKNTSLYRMNKVKIPRRNSSGHHIEIIKLSEAITTDIVKEEMNKIADDRILDPPPRYVESIPVSLDIEKERTKQKEEETKQKEEETKQLQIQEQEKTRQLELNHQLEMKKLELSHELEMKKLEVLRNRPNSSSSSTLEQQPVEEDKKEVVKKFMNTCTEFATRSNYIFIDVLFDAFENWFQERNPRMPTPLSKIMFSRTLTSIPNYSIIRIATGPRVNNVTPRKVGLIHRKFV